MRQRYLVVGLVFLFLLFLCAIGKTVQPTCDTKSQLGHIEYEHMLVFDAVSTECYYVYKDSSGVYVKRTFDETTITGKQPTKITLARKITNKAEIEKIISSFEKK